MDGGGQLLKPSIIDTLAPAARTWKPVGAGDFTGDGNTDILWRQQGSGVIGLWEMQGTQRVNALVQTDPKAINSDPVWEVVGVGDFTHDGKADILWRNRNTGENGFWEMDGINQVKVHRLTSIAADSGWEVGGVGDFTNDGNTDILWRNSKTGQNGFWEMGGDASLIQAHLIEPVDIASNWQIAGVGDFSKDGRSDILWRKSDDGKNGIWILHGGVRTDVFAGLPASLPADGWNIVG